MVFLAASFALLVLVVRLRVHRAADSRAQAGRRRLVLGDVGPAAAAAGAIALLADGFWPGAILALAAMVWLGLSAMRRTKPRDHALMTSPG